MEKKSVCAVVVTYHPDDGAGESSGDPPAGPGVVGGG